MEEMPSCFKEMPGLDDEVITLTPAALDPAIILMVAISLSD